MLKKRNLCECCFVDCRDKETGARCYRQTGFRRHHLLRLAVRQEATSAPEKTERKGEQPRGRAAGANRASRDAAETSGDLVFLHARQQLQIGVASSHQEPPHGGHQDHASGSDAAGTVPERHGGVSGVPEVV
jgi:hypothetical protein